MKAKAFQVQHYAAQRCPDKPGAQGASQIQTDCPDGRMMEGFHFARRFLSIAIWFFNGITLGAEAAIYHGVFTPHLDGTTKC